MQQQMQLILTATNFCVFQPSGRIYYQGICSCCCRQGRWDWQRARRDFLSSATTATTSRSPRPPTWASPLTSWTPRAAPWVSCLCLRIAPSLCPRCLHYLCVSKIICNLKYILMSIFIWCLSKNHWFLAPTPKKFNCSAIWLSEFFKNCR